MLELDPRGFFDELGRVGLAGERRDVVERDCRVEPVRRRRRVTEGRLESMTSDGVSAIERPSQKKPTW